MYVLLAKHIYIYCAVRNFDRGNSDKILGRVHNISRKSLVIRTVDFKILPSKICIQQLSVRRADPIC